MGTPVLVPNDRVKVQCLLGRMAAAGPILRRSMAEVQESTPERMIANEAGKGGG